MTRERGWQRVGVISSARHLRRVEAIARVRGFELDPLPSDFRGPSLADNGKSSLPFHLPSGNALATLEEALWEILGLAIVPILGG